MLDAIQKSIRACKIAIVTRAQLKAITLQEAFDTISYLFPPLGVYSTPKRLAKSLLGFNQKLRKSIDGVEGEIRGLALSQHTTLGGGVNLCAKATSGKAGCAENCLGKGMRYSWHYNREIRAARTRALVLHPIAFFKLLIYAINSLPITTAIRLNVLSDCIFEVLCPALFDDPKRQFYDYSKIPGRTPPPNYTLVFSRSGENDTDCLETLESGGIVSAVFDKELPSRFFGRPVLDGDLSDYRFRDPPGHVVGLRLKKVVHANGKRSARGLVVIQ